MKRSALPGFAIAVVVLIAGLLLAFTVGRYPVSLGDLFSVLAAKLTGQQAHVPPAVESVILQVRGPRVLAAVMVGAALAANSIDAEPDESVRAEWRCTCPPPVMPRASGAPSIPERSE